MTDTPKVLKLLKELNQIAIKQNNILNDLQKFIINLKDDQIKNQQKINDLERKFKELLIINLNIK